MSYENMRGPITAALSDELQNYLTDPNVQLILQAVWDYERGAIDLRNVGLGGPPLLTDIWQYAAVALDIAIVLATRS
jgi:hypothetical protein